MPSITIDHSDFTAKDVEDRAKEIAIEVLYDEDTGEFAEYMEGIESREIIKPLMDALKALESKKTWNNSGWMYQAIRHLEEVRKIVEREQTRDVERFEDQAMQELEDGDA